MSTRNPSTHTGYDPTQDPQTCAMVHSVAQLTASRTRGADLDDLTQEAWLAVLEAQAAWKPERGKLSSFARPSVKTRVFIAAARAKSPVTACPASTSTQRVEVLLEPAYAGEAYHVDAYHVDADSDHTAGGENAQAQLAVHGPQAVPNALEAAEAAEERQRLVRLARVVDGAIVGMVGGEQAVRYLAGEVGVTAAAAEGGVNIRTIRDNARAVRAAVEAAQEVIYGEA